MYDAPPDVDSGMADISNRLGDVEVICNELRSSVARIEAAMAYNSRVLGKILSIVKSEQDVRLQTKTYRTRSAGVHHSVKTKRYSLSKHERHHVKHIVVSDEEQDEVKDEVNADEVEVEEDEKENEEENDQGEEQEETPTEEPESPAMTDVIVEEEVVETEEVETPGILSPRDSFLEKVNGGQSMFVELDLSGGVDLCGFDFSGLRLFRANFSDATLRDVNFCGAELRFANFSNCDLDNSQFCNAVLDSAIMQNASLQRTDFEGACLDKVDLSGANLRAANLRVASMKRAILHAADVRDASFLVQHLHTIQWGEIATLNTSIFEDWAVEAIDEKHFGEVARHIELALDTSLLGIMCACGLTAGLMEWYAGLAFYGCSETFTRISKSREPFMYPKIHQDGTYPDINQMHASIQPSETVVKSMGMISILVEEHGVDINMPLANMGSALHAAILFGQRELVDFLVELGADINKPAMMRFRYDDEMRAVVHDACSDAEPAFPLDYAITPITLAVRQYAQTYSHNGGQGGRHYVSTIDAIKYILDLGADPEAGKEDYIRRNVGVFIAETLDIAGKFGYCRGSGLLNLLMRYSTLNTLKSTTRAPNHFRP